ncbi:MAG: hypothetical protein BRC27_00795 [Nanohaloarchaea archaeon SW_10_44_10]|nr:MAG: hypothetical protein BRC27_00795 [Nanohaloarchaea archaeon SW_10_44_10]
MFGEDTDYEPNNVWEQLLNNQISPIGDNLFSPEEVFYGDSEQPWDITDHFEGENNRHEIHAKAVLEDDYDMRSQALKSEEHVKGDLAYTFFKMFNSLNTATAMGLKLDEIGNITLEAESEYGRLSHQLTGEDAQQIYDDAAEEVPPEARGFQTDEDTAEDVIEGDKGLIESQAMNYFKRYQEDVEFIEVEK